MAEKDIAEKTLEACNDVFADIVNVLLFDGKQVVKEDELEAAATTSTFKADKKLHQQERDVAKFWKNGEIKISLVGFENQTQQDYKMPLRVISYDGASYKQQLLDNKQRKNFPVVTLVLYFGEKKWTAPKNLYDCLEIPEELKSYVSDYKINVFNIAWLDDETIEKFTSDFKIVAKFFQTKRMKKDFTRSTEIMRHVEETLKLLSALTGDNLYVTLYNNNEDLRNGGVNMCEVAQKILNEGRTEGRTEGREESVRNLLEAKAGTVEQIAAWLKLPIETVKDIAQKVPVQA